MATLVLGRPEAPSKRIVSSSRTTHYPQLDGLRCFAATFVVIHHAYVQVWPAASQTAPQGLLKHALAPFVIGQYAVYVFIVLSGFCLALPVVRTGTLRGGVRNYYGGRFWRIVPTYWAAVALSAGLIATVIGQPTGTHWDSSLNLTWGTFLACVVFVPEIFANLAINHVLWSVAIESKIYLVYPVIVAAWSRFGLLATSVVVSGLGVGASRLLQGQMWHGLTLWFFALFMLGVVAAAVVASADERWNRFQKLPCGWFCVAGSLTVIGLGYALGSSLIMAKSLAVVGLLIGVTTACGLISIVGRPNWTTRVLSSRPVVFIGMFAYSLYLVHAPLLQVVHQYLIFPLHLSHAGQFAVLVLVGYPLIVLAAYGFYLVIERSSLSRRRAQ